MTGALKSCLESCDFWKLQYTRPALFASTKKLMSSPFTLSTGLDQLRTRGVLDRNTSCIMQLPPQHADALPARVLHQARPNIFYQKFLSACANTRRQSEHAEQFLVGLICKSRRVPCYGLIRVLLVVCARLQADQPFGAHGNQDCVLAIGANTNNQVSLSMKMKGRNNLNFVKGLQLICVG